MIARILCLALSLLACGLVAGCHREMALPQPEYNRPLDPGAFGLRRITDPLRMPDLAPVAEQLDDPAFQRAAARSLRWYGVPSAQTYFPSGPISHAHAWASVYALAQLGQQNLTASQAFAALQADFDIWESVGWNGRGDVLYTAYFTPVFQASRTRTDRFQYPLYRRPDDLRTDPVTGEVLGSYPTRAQLEQSGKLAGLELVYLPSRLDAYIIEVNGSAKLEMRDGSTMYVGYAGTNGHDYTSLGGLLVEAGVLPEDAVSLAAIRRHFQDQPEQLGQYIRQNDRFVFFREYNGSDWPAGSMGFQVTPMRTLATDKDIFPRGSVVLVDTELPAGSAASGEPFQQLMLDQDTGGAIRAAGRADIYIGIGDRAERIAGRQKAEGRLYYLLLKPDRVQAWWDRMRQTPARTPRIRGRGDHI